MKSTGLRPQTAAILFASRTQTGTFLCVGSLSLLSFFSLSLSLSLVLSLAELFVHMHANGLEWVVYFFHHRQKTIALFRDYIIPLTIKFSSEISFEFVCKVDLFECGNWQYLAHSTSELAHVCKSCAPRIVPNMHKHSMVRIRHREHVITVCMCHQMIKLACHVAAAWYSTYLDMDLGVCNILSGRKRQKAGSTPQEEDLAAVKRQMDKLAQQKADLEHQLAEHQSQLDQNEALHCELDDLHAKQKDLELDKDILRMDLDEQREAAACYKQKASAMRQEICSKETQLTETLAGLKRSEHLTAEMESLCLRLQSFASEKQQLEAELAE